MLEELRSSEKVIGVKQSRRAVRDGLAQRVFLACDADPALTYTVEGLISGDTLTGALERTAGEDVGSYNIQQGSRSAGDNYAVTYTVAALTDYKIVKGSDA